MTKTVFERKEQKYRLNRPQYQLLCQVLQQYMLPDRNGEQTISSLYYDTEDFALIRASIEKPYYKEKLRLRGYGTVAADSRVFLELKKKCDGIVYKRREALSLKQAAEVLAGQEIHKDTQILREIRFFLGQRTLEPKLCLSYERMAYAAKEDAELRLTVDSNIRFRDQELALEKGAWGDPLLAAGELLLEIKSAGALPLWLTTALSELAIYPCSFSKFGYCYQNYLYPRMLGRDREEVARSA